MTRTMTASIAKYSAMPAQTPAIMRSSADLYRRRGPGSGEEWAAPPVGASPAVVGASEGSVPSPAGVVGSESPAGVPAGGGGAGSGAWVFPWGRGPGGVPAGGVVASSSSCVSMERSVPGGGPADHWEWSLGVASGDDPGDGPVGHGFARSRAGDARGPRIQRWRAWSPPRLASIGWF